MIDAVTSGAPAAPQGEAAKQVEAVRHGAFKLLMGVLDVVNPLQHIPVVSTLYRAITGDEIAPPARLMGAGLYGGPVGFAAAMANLALEEGTGRDVGEHVMAAVVGTDDPFARNEPEPTALASDIRWNGARQYPSPAAVAVLQHPSTTEELVNGPAIWRPSDRSTAKTENQGAAATATRNPPQQQPAGGLRSDAATKATLPPPPIGWVATALAQGQAHHGPEGTQPEVEPWIATAMMEALDQYEVLAKQRTAARGPL